MIFNAGSIVGYLKLDRRDWHAGIREALRGAASFKQRAAREFQGLKGEVSKIGQSLKSLTPAFAAVGAGIGLAVGKSFRDAMNLEEAENLFQVSFGNMANNARAWSEELGAAVGRSAASIRESAGTFNVMASSMGFSEQAAFDLAKSMTQLTMDVSSFYNLRHEEAFEKLSAGITGEAEPLKRLGILINETTVKSYAMAHGIAEAGEELSEQQKVIARVGLIMEQTQKAQGDLARTSDSATNSIRRLGDRVKELSQEFGKSLTSALGPYVNMAARAVEITLEWARANPALAAGIAQTTAAIGAVAASTAALAFIIPKVVDGFAALKVAGIASWKALLNPISLVVVAIGAAAAAIYTLRAVWIQNLDTLKTAWYQFSSKIAPPIRDAFNAVIGFANDVRERWFSWLDGLLQGVKSFANQVIGTFASVGAAGQAILEGDYAGIISRATSALQRDYIGELSIAASQSIQLLGPALQTVYEDATQATSELLESAQSMVATSLKGQIQDDIRAIAPQVADFFDELTKELGGSAEYQNLQDMIDSLMQGLTPEALAGGGGAGGGGKGGKTSAADKGAKQAAAETLRNLKEQAQAVAQLAQEGQGLYQQLVPAEGLLAQMASSVEALKAAGRLDADTANLLGINLAQQFGPDAIANIGAVIDRLNSIDPFVAEAYLEQFSLLKDEAARVVDEFTKLDDTSQIDRMRETWQNLSNSVHVIASDLSDLSSVFSSKFLSGLSRVAGGIGDLVDRFGALKEVMTASATSGVTGLMKVAATGDFITAAIQTAASVFGLFSKSAEEETSVTEELMRDVADTIKGIFDDLASRLADFIVEGTFDLKDFVRTILEDFLQLSFDYAISKPLQSLLSAKGHAFEAGQKLTAYARGGVVNAPTAFKYGGGLGVMGEAGPEAIMPLKRLGGGQLGVGAEGMGSIVQIVDQRGAGAPDMQVERSTGSDGREVIRVIVREVGQAIAQGEFDRLLGGTFGLRRQGAY